MTLNRFQLLLKTVISFAVLLPAVATPQYSDATIGSAEASYKNGKRAYDQQRFDDAGKHLLNPANYYDTF